MKIAKQKVWRTHKNELVEDGHEDATQLVARRGEVVEDHHLTRYKNADEFFVDHDSREGEAAQREVNEPSKPWTAAQIADYRNAREGDEETRSTLEKIKPAAQKEAKIAPAEKMRRKRPGPDKTSVKVKKAAAKK